MIFRLYDWWTWWLTSLIAICFLLNVKIFIQFYHRWQYANENFIGVDIPPFSWSFPVQSFHQGGPCSTLNGKCSFSANLLKIFFKLAFRSKALCQIKSSVNPKLIQIKSRQVQSKCRTRKKPNTMKTEANHKGIPNLILSWVSLKWKIRGKSRRKSKANYVIIS